MNNIEGVDNCIETSLFDYGLAWILSDCKTEYIFYYGISGDNGEYKTFDSSFIAADIDIYKEYDWVNFEKIYSYTSTDKKDFDTYSLTGQISDLLSYYGYENVFGSSYYEGLIYNANINRFQAQKGN